jgi:hypothetical protein
MAATPIKQPKETPRMKRLGFRPERERGKEGQRPGMYWDVITAQRTQAWAAKATSLN